MRVVDPIGYGVFVALGAVVALVVRHVESRRLGYTAHPGYRLVGIGCLVGAVVGARLGMLMYVDLEASRFDYTSKTVLGALAGGYLVGELTKWWVGVRYSTGDALAVALPLGQAVGRVGCFVGGCCFGDRSEVPWAVFVHGQWRHPAPLYESALLLVVAAVLWSIRKRPRPAGRLFQIYLLAYAVIRFALETVRADRRVVLGPLSVAQLFCVAGGLLVLLHLLFGRAKQFPHEAELQGERVA